MVCGYRKSFTAGGILAGLQSVFPSLQTPFGAMAASTAETTDLLEIYRVPCLKDNYVWLLKVPFIDTICCECTLMPQCVVEPRISVVRDGIILYRPLSYAPQGFIPLLSIKLSPFMPQEPSSNLTAIVDASEVTPIVRALDERCVLIPD